MNDNQSRIFEAAFKGIISALTSLAIYLLGSFAGSLDKIQESVNNLNVNIAQVIERTATQKEMLVRLEERIKRLEERTERISRPHP